MIQIFSQPPAQKQRGVVDRVAAEFAAALNRPVSGDFPADKVVRTKREEYRYALLGGGKGYSLRRPMRLREKRSFIFNGREEITSSGDIFR